MTKHFDDGSSLTVRNGETTLRIGHRIVTDDEWREHRATTRVIRDAEETLEKAFDHMAVMFQQYDAVVTVMARVPRFDEDEGLTDAEEGLRDEVVKAAYDLVRAHQRLDQIEHNPDFPFESLDESHVCPTCGYADEDVIANIEELYPSA